MKNKANVNIVLKEGDQEITPLLLAIEHPLNDPKCNCEIVALLIKHGANPYQEINIRSYDNGEITKTNFNGQFRAAAIAAALGIISDEKQKECIKKIRTALKTKPEPALS